MSTKLEYLTNTYSLEGQGNLLEIGESEKGTYAIFDKTIFYPRGGGQESDIGKITLSDSGEEIDITFVAFSEGKVYHFGNFSRDSKLNQEVSFKVNEKNRLLNSMLHTAGHLIGSIIETKTDYLRAIKGFHFSKGSYVEFNILKDIEIDSQSIINLLNEKIKEDINNGLIISDQEMTLDEIKELCTYIPSNLPEDKPLRVVTIERYFPIPCGGTHVKSTKELYGLEVHKVKKKQGNLKISYKIE